MDPVTTVVTVVSAIRTLLPILQELGGDLSSIPEEDRELVSFLLTLQSEGSSLNDEFNRRES